MYIVDCFCIQAACFHLPQSHFFIAVALFLVHYICDVLRSFHLKLFFLLEESMHMRLPCLDQYICHCLLKNAVNSQLSKIVSCGLTELLPLILDTLGCLLSQAGHVEGSTGHSDVHALSGLTLR